MKLGGLNKLPLSCGGQESYTSQYFKAQKAGLGSAFTKEEYSLVGSESIAIAHAFSQVAHMADMLTRQNLPIFATDSLEYWCRILSVPYSRSTPKHQLRDACAAKFASQQGATYDAIYSAVSTLCGASLVSIEYSYGLDLADPPVLTFWPLNPGYSERDLETPQTTAWLTARCKVIITLQQQNLQSDAAYQFLYTVLLPNLLDQILPAWSKWTIVPDGVGFILGDDPNLSWETLTTY